MPSALFLAQVNFCQSVSKRGRTYCLWSKLIMPKNYQTVNTGSIRSELAVILRRNTTSGKASMPPAHRLARSFVVRALIVIIAAVVDGFSPTTGFLKFSILAQFRLFAIMT